MNSTEIRKRTLNPIEFGKAIGTHQATVYRLIWSGKIRVLKGVDRYLIPESELERFLSETEERKAANV